MDTAKYLRSVIELAENIVHMRLSDQGKAVIENYIDSAAEESMSGKARNAIYRYTQYELPTLDQLREKNKTQELSQIDHLILKMEYEAKQVRFD